MYCTYTRIQLQGCFYLLCTFVHEHVNYIVFDVSWFVNHR